MAKKGHGKPAQTEVEAIAARLVDAMNAMDLKPAEVCARSGVAPNTFSQWINAKGAPSRLEARKLKRTLGWSLDYIFEGDVTHLPHNIAKNLGRVIG